MNPLDAVVVGAGPTGLACGIELQQRGMNVVLLDKGCVVNSIYHYPTNMSFFTTPELLEIGDIPMTSMGEKPTRGEALKYYRAEVHLREGGQDYDIMGWREETVINDVLDHYGRHLHFLAAVR